MSLNGRLYVCALLGTPPGPAIHIKGNLFFISDFVAMHHILHPYAVDQGVWLTQLNLREALWDLRDKMPQSSNVILHGPRHSPRLEFSLPRDPTGSFPWYRKEQTGRELERGMLSWVAEYAGKASSEDHLLIILFGHGQDLKGPGSGKKVECGGGLGSPVWLDRDDVAKRLQDCKAKVTILSGACFSGIWKKEGVWRLLSAAEDGESIGLTPSRSGRSWGSPFVAALLELGANEYRLTLHPELRQPHLPYLSPETHPSDLNILTHPGQLERFPLLDVRRQLSAGAFPLAFALLAEALFNAQQERHSFRPTLDPSNCQWDGPWSLLGLDSAWPVLEQLDHLPRVAANPSEHESDLISQGKPVFASLGTDGEEEETETVEEEVAAHDMDSQALNPSQMLLLDSLTDLWVQRVRPTELITASQICLGAFVDEFRMGNLNDREKVGLFRSLQARTVADQLAQDLADGAGIAGPGLPCREVREGCSEPPACQGVKWGSFDWGVELMPDNDVVINHMRRPYKKASQWLFSRWSDSGAPVSVLEQILQRANACSNDMYIQSLFAL
ncbi:hypothetical protein FB45DRAFT_1133322 [Roridomyces roridus]|uniref:Uncharacterized protein n=1 Tax=Roridomyces roridus TaxID=1738132 RepID=A0AAD7FUN3_9AGAR|nr:hypothetical protein FB45DRAFT_1133322 [Roridomyces roridus]